MLHLFEGEIVIRVIEDQRDVYDLIVHQIRRPAVCVKVNVPEDAVVLALMLGDLRKGAKHVL